MVLVSISVFSCDFWDNQKKVLMKIFIFTLIFSFQSLAYVISKSDSGANLKWLEQGSQIELYINPIPLGRNTAGISSSSVMSIFQNSIDEWNKYSPYELVPTYTTNTSGKNSIEFSDDASLLGSGVVAITEVNYNSNNGYISSANIYFNESGTNGLLFTDNEAISGEYYAYLGDVLTHELGHFLGLSHSEVVGSSMIYSVFKNQHELHSDDYLGVWDIYDKVYYTGEIKGNVVGGQAISVFGAHVSLIATSTMEVYQSQVTNEQGEFHFKNLPTDESYLIYVSPFKNLSTISDYYSTALSSYCSSGTKYKASFFTQCGPRSSSRPQGIYLDSSSSSAIDIGEISIKCDENIDSNYLKLKNETSDREYQIVNSYQKSSFIFYGIFSDDEIDNGLAGQGDEFEIDLRFMDISDLSTNKLYLDVISSGIGSAFDFYILIKRDDEAGYSVYTSTSDETGKKITDQKIELSLSSTASDNLFSIRVFPLSLSSSDMYDIFSTQSTLKNDNSIYILSAQVGARSNDTVGGLDIAISEYGDQSFDDNSLCLEGDISYSTEAYAPLNTSQGASQIHPEEDDLAAVSCATVDLDNNGGGPGSVIFSFFIGAMMVFSFRYLNLRRDNFV